MGVSLALHPPEKPPHTRYKPARVCLAACLTEAARGTEEVRVTCCGTILTKGHTLEVPLVYVCVATPVDDEFLPANLPGKIEPVSLLSRGCFFI